MLYWRSKICRFATSNQNLGVCHREFDLLQPVNPVIALLVVNVPSPDEHEALHPKHILRYSENENISYQIKKTKTSRLMKKISKQNPQFTSLVCTFFQRRNQFIAK